MIWAALEDKYRTRGPVGIAADIVEVAAASYVVGAYELMFGSAALALLIVASPFLAWDALARPRASACTCVNSFDECRCGRGRP